MNSGSILPPIIQNLPNILPHQVYRQARLILRLTLTPDVIIPLITDAEAKIFEHLRFVLGIPLVRLAKMLPRLLQ